MIEPSEKFPGYEFMTTPSPERRYFTIPTHLTLKLDCGKILPQATLAYETYGCLNEAGTNAILVCHALTGDSHVAAHESDNGDFPGWWDAVVGPGKPLDTREYFIISSNVIGGCQGSTGPWSFNPATGRPYGSDFPIVTVRDMVRAQKILLDHLGVKGLVSVIGGSMGGMQVLEWALLFPSMVESIIPIASCGKMSAQGIAFNEVQRQAILGDPDYDNGHYYLRDGPVKGISIARMLGMITYQSDESMRKKFDRGFQTDEKGTRYSWEGMFKVESYLRYQGRKLANRFDANTYMYLSKAMDLHDVSYDRESPGGDALGSIRAKTLVIGIDSDILFPTYQQKEIVQGIRSGGGNAEYVEIHSPCGHDAFLIEFDVLNPILHGFLEGVGIKG